MSDEKSRFLDLASQGFGDDHEKRHASRALLDSQLSSDQALMNRASEQMELSDQRSKWLSWGVPVAVIVIGLLLVLFPAYNLYRAAGIMGGNSFLGIPVPTREHEPWAYYFKDLSAEDQMLLFGDVSIPDEVDRRESFWRTEPGNTGAYIEYLTTYRMENGNFPEDMLQVSQELDPDNAIFYFFQIGVLAEECTEKVYPSRGRSSRRSRRGRGSSATVPASTPAVTRKHVAITDVEMHREALVLLRKAGALPKCNDYSHEMMLRRFPLLQWNDHDWVSRIIPFTYLASQMSHSMSFMKVSRVIQAEAYRCEQEKDAAALKQLVADWVAYCRHTHASSRTLVDGLVLRASIHAPCKDFAAAAKVCELKEMESYFTDLDKQMVTEKKSRDAMAKSDDWGDKLHREGSILSSMSLPIIYKQVNDASAIPHPDTGPDRRADHAFWNRVSSAVQWKILLLVSLIAGLWRSRCNVLVRKLGQRLACVFSWRDWLFVLLWGSFLPMGLYWLVNGTDTVMSVQRYNLSYSAMLLAAGQSGGLIILLVLTPILFISCRLKRVLPLHVAPSPRMIWAAAILVIVSLPVFGLAGTTEHGIEEKIRLGFGLQAIAILLLLATPFVAMIRKQKEARYMISKAVRGQKIIRVYLLSSLLMALHVPVYHIIEKHWVAEDQIFKLSPDYTSFTMSETLVTKQLLKELDALLTKVSQDIPKLSP